MGALVHFSTTPVGARRVDACILLVGRWWRRIVAASAPAIRACDRLPAWAWPALVAATAWPSIVWTARRWSDGSDDPLGVLALATLALAMVAGRMRSGHSGSRIRTWWLLASAVVATLSVCGAGAMPDLLRAALAMAAFVLALAAVVDEDEPFLPYAGLAFLALPLLSSLQFYAGFPLRVVTAEATRWMLTAIGETVVREGSALTVDGRLVLVDAPCSGVRMAWVGYFTACTAACLFRVGDRALVRRLPFVGLAVLSGNIVRNAILVFLEARSPDVSDSTHETIGLVVLALVCGAIVAMLASATRRARPVRGVRIERGAVRLNRAGRADGVLAPIVLAVLVLVLAATVPAGAQRVRSDEGAAVVSVEWPVAFGGRPLVPVALSDVERRFAAGFPGAIGRFDNGGQVVVLRDVVRPTRRLHPASDCYRALGYAIADERLERADGAMSRCFRARRGTTSLRVCERIEASDGGTFTDASSWYWAAVLGRSHGPWRAWTTAANVTGEPS